MNQLEKIFYNNENNIIHKWIHYFDIYHKYFEPFVGKDCVIVEIGVDRGGSLQMWRNYFGDNAKIIGIDINPKCKVYETENIQILIGSQSDRKFLKEIKNTIPGIDILIDDGGHTMEQQIISFRELYSHINNNGIYLCEDLHTSYWKEYGGGLNNPSTFIEFSKSLIDELNGWHIREHNSISDYTKSINSIHFYDSIVVVEKKKREMPKDEMRGVLSLDSYLDGGDLTVSLFNLKLNLLGEKIPIGIDILELMRNEDAIKEFLKEKYDGRNWPKEAVTMIGLQRLSNIEYCVQQIIKNQIDGDLVETGVWKGGTVIFMKAILQAYGILDRKVIVADSFEGLPKPNSELYPADEGDELFKHEELSISLEQVKENFRNYNLLDDSIIFIKGWFKDSIPTITSKNISILRLDGDLYESTIDVLLYLYPKLSIGGYCIIDDWGAIPACKKAVEDYREINNMDEEIKKIDWTGVFWQKKKDVDFISRESFIEFINKQD